MNSLALKFIPTLTLCLLTLSAQQLQAQVDSIVVDSVLVGDSTTQDSIVSKKNGTFLIAKGALEEEVRYEAADSIVYDIANKRVYLYGLAVVDYTDMHLEAHRIKIDWGKNEMWAYPKQDSLKRKVKEPVKLADKGREGTADSLAYNFKTKKGKIYNFRTKEGNAYVQIANAKKNENDVLYAGDAKFTTCDKHEPHFWLQLNKAKIIPQDKVITSYAYAVVEGVPFYFVAVPFAYIPTNTQKASSGLIFPQYGFSPGRGYFLNDMGYYFALSDRYDLSVTGDFFSYGSWGLSAQSRYKVRYKRSGNASVDFNRNFYDNGKGEFEGTNEFKVAWTHSQDPKSIPGMTFSSSVNIGTAGYNRNNSFDNDEILNSRMRSSVNFGKTFKGTPFRMSLALNHNQNLLNRTISFSLPTGNISMNRINPFENSRKGGKFLQNLGFDHNIRFQNSLSTFDTMLFNPAYADQIQWDRGLSHSLPINTSLKLLKYISVNPSFNYKGYYSFYEQVRTLNDTGVVEVTRNPGSFYNFDYNFGTSINTQIYGTFNFKKSKNVVGMRHVITPTVSFNYTPDFTAPRWNYYDTVLTSLEPDKNGNDQIAVYHRFGQNPLGSTTAGQNGSISFGVNNNLELKMRDKKDTVDLKATRKVQLIRELSIGGSYNFFADSLNMSRISVRGRTVLWKSVNVNTSATFDPYEYNTETGQSINRFLWNSEDRKLAELQRFNLNVNTSLKKAIIEKWFQKDKDKKPGPKQGILTPQSKYYTKYKFPFDMRIQYDFDVTRSLEEYNTKQTVGLSGSFEPTNKWRVQYTYNYDLQEQQMSYSNFRFSRDLHCWEFSFDWTPSGARQGFYFSLRARSAELSSIKLDKNSQFWDNQ